MSVIMLIILTVIVGSLLWLALVGAVVLLILHLSRRKDHSAKVTVPTTQPSEMTKTLGSILKENRIRCSMTQEFVAEQLEVSRQAVSKWENGTSDPSTSNLIALSRLYQISPEELLKEVRK